MLPPGSERVSGRDAGIVPLRCARGKERAGCHGVAATIGHARGCKGGGPAAFGKQTSSGYCSEFARAVVPARVKLNLTSMIRCFSESVGANVHFFDAWMASRSK